MKDVIQNVKTHIIFHFEDGRSYELPLKTREDESLKTYGTRVKLNEQIYARSSDNIVGNIVGNSLNIDLISLDKLLLPSNELSTYYGLMNDTAYVDVSCDVVDDNKTVYMGRYYVNSWECGNTSSTTNEAYISCVDLLSIIKNIAVDKLRLKKNISFNDYLKMVIDTLNSKLPSHMHILYDDDDLNIWKNSDYAWQMYFNNIDRDDIQTLFNSIAKYTISYIWIDRDRHIRTDHLLDDKETESVCDISGRTNLLEYGTQTGDIDKFSGIKVKYIESVTSEDKLLLNLKDIQLYSGTNKILDQRMNSDKVLDIHTIEIKTGEGMAYVTSFSNYKNSIDMVIRSTKKTLAEINVYGTVMNEFYNTVEKYKDNSKKDAVAEIENRVLIKELIPTYTDGLLTLMTMKNNQMYASGFINPQIRVGDTVHMVGTNMNINDYYKITGLEFTLGTNYRCKATMIKTIKMDRNVDDILAVHNLNLLDELSGVNISPSQYPDISASDNDICERILAPQLAQLRAVL